jgi:hypothetical protein
LVTSANCTTFYQFLEGFQIYMEFLGLLALGVAAMLGVVAGDDSTWSSGRATFYGGNDASGTMGKPTENFIRRLISAVSYNSVLADLRG